MGLIVSDQLLGRVTPLWEESGLFEADSANLLATWCVDYYERYSKAPGKAIESIFRRWGETEARDDDKKIEVIHKLLASLSGEYDRLNETVNADYLTDLASDIFNATKLRRKMRLVEGDLAKGDVKKAVTRWEETHPFELGQQGWIDPASDTLAQEEMFAETGKTVIEYKGAFGRFLDDNLQTDSFVGLLGSEKRGKSIWLLEFVWRAMVQKTDVAYFVIGDMSRPQVMRRLTCRAAKRPYKATSYKYPKEIAWAGEPVLAYSDHEFDRPLTPEEGKRAWKSTLKKMGVEKTGMRLSCHPSLSITMTGLRTIVTRWFRDGYQPKVIVIDYADNLGGLNPKESSRDQINRNWALMRQMSQEFHCLVLTATQADAKSYDADLLRKNNFSEDKRKYGHVTAMYGLNQSDKDKEAGLYRVNCLVGRECPWGETEVCHTAGVQSIYSPVMKAIWRGQA